MREFEKYLEIEENEPNKNELNENKLNENKTNQIKPKLILPSEYNKLNNEEKYKDKIQTKKQYLKIFKLAFIISLGILLYLFYDSIILFFFNILKQNPTLYQNFLYIQNHISNNTVLGIFFLGILGSLFFLALPSEALFIYFLSSTSYLPIIIIALIICGNLIALIFNYFIGWILGEKIVQFIFKKNFFKYKDLIEKYGGFVIFLGNIFPGPFEILSVFYGSFKFEFSRYVFLAFMGRLIKYILITIAFYFYWNEIISFYYSIKFW